MIITMIIISIIIIIIIIIFIISDRFSFTIVFKSYCSTAKREQIQTTDYP